MPGEYDPDDPDTHGDECCCETCLQNYPERDALYNDNAYYGLDADDDEWTEADQLALDEYRRQEGSPVWADEMEVDGVVVQYRVHGSPDEKTRAALAEVVCAFVKRFTSSPDDLDGSEKGSHEPER